MVAHLVLIPRAASDNTAADDAALVDALRRRDRTAEARVYARDGARVRRVVARILGAHATEVDDVVHDAFLAAFRRIDSLRDATKLTPWLLSVAVGEARHHLRAKRRRAWLSFIAPAELPEAPAAPVDASAAAAVRATYAILERLDSDERIAFALRHLEGLELIEAAALCGVSLATFKRRLRRADDAFAKAAREHPALDAYTQAKPGAPT